MVADRTAWDKLITVELTVAEAHYARGACRHASRKLKRQADRSGFVPEAGKRNSGLVKSEALSAAATKLARGVQSVVRDLYDMREEPELSET